MIISLTHLLFEGEPISGKEEMRSGKVAVDGVIRAGETVSSPVKGRPCIAFFYESFLVVMTQGMGVPKKYKKFKVFLPFDLEIEGDFKVSVVPSRSDSFDGVEHRRLLTGGPPGYRATEEVILDGTRVRVHGRARREGDRYVIRMKRMQVLPHKSENGQQTKAARKRKRKAQRARV